MSDIRALGYVGFEATDLQAWKSYATEVVGLQIGSVLEDGTLVLRADEYERRILIHPGESNDVVYSGWELRDEESLNEFVSHLKEKGVEVIHAEPELAKARGALDMYYFHDADNLRQEVFYGAVVVNDKPFRSPVGQQSFITGEQGIGHIVLGGPKYKEQVDFYRNIMKFRISDFNDLQVHGVPIQGHLTFLRCNPRHHSLALSNFPTSRKFNHLMLEVSSLDQVGLTYERAKKNGAHILMDLGQHTNDKVFSFYMLTPSGWAIEVGWGGITIDEETWHVTHHPETSIWGHQFKLPTPK